MENFENKKNNRIRKNITLPPLANEIVKLMSEEDCCSESETIGRIIKDYVKEVRPDFYKKARKNLDVLEEEKERF